MCQPDKVEGSPVRAYVGNDMTRWSLFNERVHATFFCRERL